MIWFRSPLYFPLFSDEEASALSSRLICSLQQSVLLPFSQAIFAQTVFLPGILFFCVSPDSVNFLLPSRTSSAPASSAEPFTRMQPHQSFLNFVCVCVFSIFFFLPRGFFQLQKGQKLKGLETDT